MIRLELPGTPLPYRAPFVGTRGAWNPRTPIIGQMKAILRGLFRPERPIPFNEAVAVDVFFCMPIPKGVSKKRRALMVSGEIRPIKRPDVGNLAKLAHDVLIGVAIEDDSLIVDGRLAKVYAEDPKTIFHIYPIYEYLL